MNPETTVKTPNSLSATDDYLFFSLYHSLTQALHICVTYMQTNTPYGDEYKAAFDKYREILKGVEELDSLLADCVKARKSKQGE